MSEITINNKPAPRRRNRRANTTVVVDALPTKSVRNRRRRQRRQQKKKSSYMNMTPTHIAKCTVEYAKALVNPFGVRETLPCIPDTITLPSFKYQVKARGVFSTGVRGFGFCVVNPFQGAIYNGGITGAYCSAPVIYTDQSYSLTNVDYSASGGTFNEGGVNFANTNSNFSLANFTDLNREIRLVAAGVRCKYIGSNFRNQGRLIIGRMQGNVDVPIGSTTSSLLEDHYTVSLPVSRKSEYTFYTPDNQALLSYNAMAAFVTSTASLSDKRSLYIVVDGGDPDIPQSWEFEYTAYFEAIGRSLSLSPSHSDPAGMGIIHSSLPVKNPSSAPGVTENSLFKTIGQNISEQFGYYAPKLAGAATTAAFNYMMRQTAPVMNFPTIEEAD